MGGTEAAHACTKKTGEASEHLSSQTQDVSRAAADETYLAPRLVD